MKYSYLVLNKPSTVIVILNFFGFILKWHCCKNHIGLGKEEKIKQGEKIQVNLGCFGTLSQNNISPYVIVTNK